MNERGYEYCTVFFATLAAGLSFAMGHAMTGGLVAQFASVLDGVDGEATDDVDERGRLEVGDTLLILMNGGARPCSFQLPDLPQRGRWEIRIHTAQKGARAPTGSALAVPPHTLILLSHGAPR